MIDQGDGSEHDWSCIYSVLMFPLRHSIDALNSAESHVYHVSPIDCKVICRSELSKNIVINLDLKVIRMHFKNSDFLVFSEVLDNSVIFFFLANNERLE